MPAISRLKKLRKDKRLTQDDMAEFLNISTATYSRYENGIHEPDVETLIKLADFFDVTIDYLLGRDLGTMERLEKNLARLDPRIKQAYHSLQDMDEEDLAMTLELIKVIEERKKKKG